LPIFISSGFAGVPPDRSVGTVEGRIQSALIRHGFENVAVIQDSASIVVTYENRLYRFEARAIREVLNLVAKEAESSARIVLIPQNRGVPLVAVSVDSNVRSLAGYGNSGEGNAPAGIEVTLDVESYWKKLKNRLRVNSSTMKADIFVHPQFIARFGNIHDFIESQINLAPAVETSAWKGMSLSAQWIFPLQNELGYEGDYGRPGCLTLNQTVRLPSNTFISGTLGYFSAHRYGGDLEVKKFWKNGRWAAGVNAGCTAFAAYLKHVWYYSDRADWTYFLSGQYRFSKLDLTLKATWGKFIYHDKGVRLDVSRQFDEVDVGFFILRTGEGRNGGFSFSIPIFPSKRLSPGRVRISPAPYFPWSYWYKGMTDYGLQYQTQNNVDGFFKKLNPDFVKSQFFGYAFIR
jgi:hypothetical protein